MAQINLTIQSFSYRHFTKVYQYQNYVAAKVIQVHTNVVKLYLYEEKIGKTRFIKTGYKYVVKWLQHKEKKVKNNNNVFTLHC